MMAKKVLYKLLFPHPIMTITLSVMSAALLSYIFYARLEGEWYAYGVFALSFYSLCVLCAFCVRTLPKISKKTKKRLHENKYTDRYLTDRAYKTDVDLLFSLLLNTAYVAFNAVNAALQHTAWFALLAAYYAAMAVMRLVLVVRCKSRLSELRRCIACAVILMAINPIISGYVLMAVYMGRGFSYDGVFIYVIALYTFCVTSSAVYDIIKYGRYDDPTLSAAKMIKLAASLVSMLSLETAMFSQFGADMAKADRDLTVMLTGGGISLVIITSSIYTVKKCTRHIKEEKKRIGANKNGREKRK